MPLELLPQSDPTTTAAGEKLSFQLLENGRPLSGLPIGCLTEKSSQRTFQTTDADGRATFSLEAVGRALFFTVHLEWRDDHWESNFSTVTIDVGAPQPVPRS